MSLRSEGSGSGIEFRVSHESKVGRFRLGGYGSGRKAVSLATAIEFRILNPTPYLQPLNLPNVYKPQNPKALI